MSEEPPMFEELLHTVSGFGCLGERAWETVPRLHRLERWSTWPSYARASELCEELLRGAGGLQVERVPFPADGRTKFADWMMPLSWDVAEATLDLLGPSARRLANYRSQPQSLVTWSAPTPPAGAEGELLVLEHGTADELSGVDARGRIVFTPKHPTEMKAAAARAGALGIVSDWTRAKELPDVRQWINTWSDAPGGWAMHAGDSRLWGFTLSPREGQRLREEARANDAPLRLRVCVESRLYDGDWHYVTAVLPGETDEEVLLTAHINEQGANDNAAGVSAVLEVARTLAAMTRAGTRLRRTVRFLLMPESYGTIAYAVNERERLRQTRVALNVDSGAGAYDHPDSVMDVFMNPHCCPNWSDAVLAGIVQAYYEEQGRPDKWRLNRYMLAGDNFLCDPLLGVPHPWLWMGDGGDYWHNTSDTPDRVDPRSLRDLCRIVAAFTLFTAQADEAELRSHAQAARAGLPEPVRQLVRLPGEAAAVTPAQGKEAALVPRRSCPGALTLDGVPVDRWGPVTSSPRWWGPRLAAWWWAGGTHSMGEITALIEREFGSSTQELADYFEWLRGLGYVDW